MGDAGSTVLGYLFAALPLVAASETKGAMAFDRLLTIAVLLLWPFLFDGAFTILHRPWGCATATQFPVDFREPAQADHFDDCEHRTDDGCLARQTVGDF